MGLSRKDLGSDEEIVLSLRPSLTPLVLPTIVLLVAVALGIFASTHTTFATQHVRTVAAMVLIAAAALWFLARLLAWRSRSLVLTTKRVLVIKGVLVRRQDQVALERIQDAQIHRSVKGRLLGRGDVIVELVDAAAVVIEDVPKPSAFARVMLRTRDAPAREDLTANPTQMIRVVTEGDPTPPRGTPAVNASQAAVIEGRLKEVEALERSGHLTSMEASQRRAAILEEA